MMTLDAVLKVGGSLGRVAGLADLGQALGQLAGRRRLLVVPGGGVFADLVREQYRLYRLSEPAAHRMALLAMDQFGYLLAEVVPGGITTPDLDVACQVAACGRVPILLPASLLIAADPLPNSWQVTSDSLAAWIAGRVGAPRCVLLKDVDGLFPSGVQVPTAAGREAHGPIGAHRRPSASDSRVGSGPTAGSHICDALSVEALAAHRGGVDETLATVLAGLDLETWVINGRHPERLAELLATGTTVGTRIRPRSG